MNEEATGPDPRTGAAPGELEQKEFALRLYVSGGSEHARQAVLCLTKLCEQSLRGRCDLEVIDVFQQPELAQADKVVAAPTLIRRRPLPIRRISGDLSKPERVLKLLGLPPETGPGSVVP